MARLTARDMAQIEDSLYPLAWGWAADNTIHTLLAEVRRLQALLCVAWTADQEDTANSQSFDEVTSEVEAIQAEARAQREGE